VGLFKATKAAMADEAAQKQLAKTLQTAAGATRGQIAATESWITKQGRALGVTDDELRPALQRLAVATGDVGKAQKLAALGMDVSAGTGKSLEAVTTALAKAQNGSVGGLARLGIATKDASGKTKTFAQITEDLGNKFQGAASTKANTFQGKMQRLKVVFDETKEAIGARLLPILTKMATWFLEKALPAIDKFFKGMKSGQGTAGAFGKILNAVGTVVKAVAGWISRELVPFIKDLVKRFKDASGGTSGFKKTLKDLKPAIDVVKAVLKVLWAGLKLAAKVIIPIVVTQLKIAAKVIGALGRVAKWLWNNAFQPLFKFLAKGVALALNLFGKLFRALSRVPGFGWAKKAANALENAARGANRFANAIRDIPSNKRVNVTTTYWSTRGGVKRPHGDHGVPRARGGPMTGRRAHPVGERGPEIFRPYQSGAIMPNAAARRMANNGSAPGVTINFNGLVTDPKATAREVRKVLLDLKRGNGGAALGLA
jgi:hypothetical protein